MSKNKYTKKHFDHCDYFRHLKDRSFIYLLLYVDDILIASQIKVEIEELNAWVRSEFKMKDLGETEDFKYGDQERQNEGNSLFVSKTVYAEGVK